MVFYDHALVGATLALSVGAQRRHGWPVVVLAALAGMFPDWDALPKHVSPRTYQIGHRVWGHNLFAATLAGVALGGLGYWIHQSRPHRPTPIANTAPSRIGPWIVLGVLIVWSHPLLDLLYCGWDRDADWPVGLLWPVVTKGFACPWVPWNDCGATAILLIGLLVSVLVPPHRQRFAGGSLSLLGAYVGVRGFYMQWG